MEVWKGRKGYQRRQTASAVGWRWGTGGTGVDAHQDRYRRPLVESLHRLPDAHASWGGRGRRLGHGD
jgi:hypothetical protein